MIKAINSFMKDRYLFVRFGCPHCAVWLSFIEDLNLKLPIDKRIEVIDCGYYDKHKFLDNPLLLKYEKHLTGFPTLFFEGWMMDGATEKEEMEIFCKVLLQKDFIFPEFIEGMYDKECREEVPTFFQRLFGRKGNLICK